MSNNLCTPRREHKITQMRDHRRSCLIWVRKSSKRRVLRLEIDGGSVWSAKRFSCVSALNSSNRSVLSLLAAKVNKTCSTTSTIIVTHSKEMALLRESRVRIIISEMGVYHGSTPNQSNNLEISLITIIVVSLLRLHAMTTKSHLCSPII